ncbi:MAG TPA: hypothetical protein V6D12_00570 [Candidatus Obscuribacterales bacterium]
MHDFAQLKIKDLRSLARELNLSVDDIRKYGDLRCRKTWIDGIKATATQEPEPAIAQEQSDFVSNSELVINLITSCDCTQKTAIAHEKNSNCIKLGTSGQNVQKLETEPEIGFIDGQLAVTIPLPEARTVAMFAEAGRWAEAFEVVRGNQRATRILSRIREVVA